MVENRRIIALRMDDPGASSKKYEVYSKWPRNIGNFLFLKYIEPFRAWGPYGELNSADWTKIIDLLEKYKAKLTVAITACWVEWNGTLVPFNEKFPEVIPVIKDGIDRGVIKIASHGLTHCVLNDFAFRPKYFKGNRNAHREFWDYIDYETQLNHLQNSKKILESSFGVKINLIVPPGNVFSQDTVNAAIFSKFSVLNCNEATNKNVERFELKIIDNSNIVAFHDREVKLIGIAWLENILKKYAEYDFKFVEELF